MLEIVLVVVLIIWTGAAVLVARWGKPQDLEMSIAALVLGYLVAPFMLIDLLLRGGRDKPDDAHDDDRDD